MSDYNYFQQIEFKIPLMPDTRSWVQKKRDRMKWRLYGRWRFWYRYDRGTKIARYREWWRERP